VVNFKSFQRFLDSVSEMALDSRKGLRQDVPTRWNSTFIMLESALYYQHAFCHLELILILSIALLYLSGIRWRRLELSWIVFIMHL
jgi:hypothetical protein